MFLLPFPLLSDSLPLGFYKAKLHSALYWPDSCPIQTTVNQNKLSLWNYTISVLKSRRTWTFAGTERRKCYNQRKRKNVGIVINLMVISPSLCAGMLQSACSVCVPNISSTLLSSGHQGTEATKTPTGVQYDTENVSGSTSSAYSPSFKNSPRLFFAICLVCFCKW